MPMTDPILMPVLIAMGVGVLMVRAGVGKGLLASRFVLDATCSDVLKIDIVGLRTGQRAMPLADDRAHSGTRVVLLRPKCEYIVRIELEPAPENLVE